MKQDSLKTLLGMPDKNTDFKSSTDYSSWLKTLNKASLQSLCMEQGLIPGYDRSIMIKSLEKQFKKKLAKAVNQIKI